MHYDKLIIFLLLVCVLVLFYKTLTYNKKKNESYCSANMYADPRLIPEYPTYDHYRRNNWTRYDLKSDDDPFSPYFKYGPIPY